MALDFYNISDRGLKQRLFKLTDVDMESLANVLREYRKATGLRIDEYGTTKISQGHVELIIKLLNNNLTQAYLKPSIKERLSDIAKQFSQSKEGLIAVGA